MDSVSPRRSGLLSLDATGGFLLVCLLFLALGWSLPEAASPAVLGPKAAAPQATRPPYKPTIAPASDAGQRRLAAMKIPAGFTGTLFASEPSLANPVAFWVDERQRVFVAETFRQETHGVPDNRSHRHWIPADLASMTVEDRRAMYLRYEAKQSAGWATEQDRVRLVEDRDGDGKAEHSSVFADGFHDLLDGTGAGVLFRKGKLYYTCIPNLWELDDRDDDGVCEARRSLATGFGVRVALRGHDLHGLCLGPDERLYFSIGDRGYNITTREGRHLFDPKSGAVFRCELDGSDLEVFATGLRNPQELAFDDLGNLFTGDNNADGGDKARLVYVVEGGNTGWRMNFQYIDKRGPWMKERWCEPRHEGQAAFLNPPVATLGAGPSGLCFNPGCGLPPRYDRNFFLCDFRGGAAHSGVWAFRCDQDGAGFRLTNQRWFLRGALVTDVQIGTDGRVWISDFAHGWIGEGKGRLYTFRHPAAESRRCKEAAELLRSDFRKRSLRRLKALLAHPDRRVRREAQWALVARPKWALGAFEQVARRGPTLLSRVHAIWGLGQLAKRDGRARTILEEVARSQADEIRAQALKVLGEAGDLGATQLFVSGLRDPYPRVQYFGALGLARIADASLIPVVADFLERNADHDHYLRHAGVMALTAMGPVDPGALGHLLEHPSASVRLGAVLALRRLKDPRLSRCLDDAEERIVVEAALAIYDVPVPECIGALASRLNTLGSHNEALALRMVGANDLIGGEECARRLARFAADPSRPSRIRRQALRILEAWAKPPATEWVLNRHQPRTGRKAEDAASALAAECSALAAVRDPGTEEMFLRCAKTYGFDSLRPLIHQRLADSSAEARVRIAALEALRHFHDPALPAAAALALESEAPSLRAKGIDVVASFDPGAALPILKRALEGSSAERQAAVRCLAKLKCKDADGLLLALAEKLDSKEPSDIALEVMEGLRLRKKTGPEEFGETLDRYDKARALLNPVEQRLSCLLGGDPSRGRRVFEKSAATCLRCHVIDQRVSELAGPSLLDVGRRKTRRELLEAIVLPNATIAPGYEMVLLETEDGELLDGRVLKESAKSLTLEVADGSETRSFEVLKSNIKSRRASQSAMPGDTIKHLKAHQLRDLIAFLTTLDGTPPEKNAAEKHH